jgi:hypothetical protein
MRLITVRNFIVYIRIPWTSILKVIVCIAVAGFVSLMFHGLDGSISGVRNRNGVLFFETVSIAFIA